MKAVMNSSATKEPTLPPTSLSRAERLGLVGGMSSATEVVNGVGETVLTQRRDLVNMILLNNHGTTERFGNKTKDKIRGRNASRNITSNIRDIFILARHPLPHGRLRKSRQSRRLFIHLAHSIIRRRLLPHPGNIHHANLHILERTKKEI